MRENQYSRKKRKPRDGNPGKSEIRERANPEKEEKSERRILRGTKPRKKISGKTT